MAQPLLLMSTRQPNWLPLIDLALSALAAALCLTFPVWGAWPLLLALLPWALRLWQTGRLPFMTPLAVPLWLFNLTALVALWAAYNPTAAWAKFWILLAAMFLFYSLANQPPAQLWPIAKLLSLLTILIAGYFLLTHDWQADPIHIGMLDGLAQKWMSIRPPVPPLSFPPMAETEEGASLLMAGTEGGPLHPNQAAGFIVVLVPFAVAVAWYEWATWPIIRRGITALAAGVILFALLLTGSRGAWLALAAAISVYMGTRAWSQLSHHLARFMPHSQPRIFRLGLGLAFLITLALLYLFPTAPLNLANRLPGAATAGSRAAIYSNTLYLVADFPFTGAGLAAFPGLYSQYILVIPQRIFTYAHNLFLDVALEQGILGLLALSAMLVGSLWLLRQRPDQPRPTRQLSLLRWAVAVALVVMIGRGLVDDAFYANRGTPLLWLLPGLAIAANRATLPLSPPVGGMKGGEGVSLPPSLWPVVTLILFLSVAAIFILPQGRAAWLANLGAVRMAQVELSDWPTDKWADGHYLPALRSTEQLFRQALEIYPANRTAHHRLGMIAMLQRDFETAVTHLEAAQQTDPDHIGIHKSLVYSYIWNDQLDKAQTILADIPEAQNELKIYAWWWGTQGRDDLAAQAERMLE